MNNLFYNGSQWLRADFHLHTNADKEFEYEPASNESDSSGNFVKTFVGKLDIEGVQIGAITNHNKFDLDEFKRIKKEGRKANMLFLAGVELSVNDGANGIHCLVIFNKEWYSNREGEDYINLFLTEVFGDTANREHENTRCKKNLIDLLRLLKEHKEKGRDSFVIMAHVEDRCGFFKEFEGGRIESLIKEKSFQEFVLGFQKVRTFDKVAVWKQWFRNASVAMPAFIEGSDCKSIVGAGVPHQQTIAGKKTDKISYLKIGHPSFDAVKFALINHKFRVFADACPDESHAFIKDIKFTGGKLSDEILNLNPNLNCLIGLPGSGKSSVVETIRYILGHDLPVKKNEKNHNQGYKEGLVEHFMGSGGTGIISFKSKEGAEYTIERTLNDDCIIKNSEGDVLNIDIQEIISFLYFGQKDLTYQNKDNFNNKFLHRFLEKEVRPFEKSISKQNGIVVNLLKELGEIETVKEQKFELEQKLNAANEKLRLYKEHEIDKKMEKQKKFEDDISFLEDAIKENDESLIEIYNITYEKLESLNELEVPESSDNKLEIDKAAKEIDIIKSTLNNVLEKINALLPPDENESDDKEKKGVPILNDVLEEIQSKETEFKKEFERIRREIQVENLDVDAYPKITRKIEKLEKEIQELTEEIQQEEKLRKELDKALKQLRKLWKKEKEFYVDAIKKINAKGLSVSVVLNESGNKKSLTDKLKGYCSGSNIRSAKFIAIANQFDDTIKIWKDLDKEESSIKAMLSDTHFSAFKLALNRNKSDLLTFKIPYSFELMYQGKPIEKHSDGQRASALILFTLGIGKQDLLIIDQPEDDLNSGDIYKEIVQTLLQSKHSAQFIFATHDANITVLGDCEQMFCCDYYDHEMSYKAGSIDDHESQKNVISVMEGGEEAFSERNKIYSTWKQIT